MCVSATKYKFPQRAIIATNIYGGRCPKLPLLIEEYCPLNPFKFIAEISVVHQKLHTWFKVIASLESKFNTQNIALQLSKSFSSQTTNYLTKI